jgi:hypothetical protein
MEDRDFEHRDTEKMRRKIQELEHRDTEKMRRRGNGIVRIKIFS